MDDTLVFGTTKGDFYNTTYWVYNLATADNTNLSKGKLLPAEVFAIDFV